MDTIEQQVVEFVQDFTKQKPVYPSQTLWRDLGIDGDDATEFLEEFAKRFNVDMTHCTEKFFGSEGWNIFAFYQWIRYFLTKDKYKTSNLKSLSVQMLIDAAKSRRWPEIFSFDEVTMRILLVSILSMISVTSAYTRLLTQGLVNRIKSGIGRDFFLRLIGGDVINQKIGCSGHVCSLNCGRCAASAPDHGIHLIDVDADISLSRAKIHHLIGGRINNARRCTGERAFDGAAA